MKKCVSFFIVLAIMLLLASCAADPAVTTNTPNTNPSEDDTVLDHPPELFVIYGEQRITALFGTTSWSFPSEGEIMSLEGMSEHPLMRKDLTPMINLLSTSIPADVDLQFSPALDTLPDTIIVRCWKEEHWGNADAESEDTEFSVNEGHISFPLKDGNYIYEVVAIWNGSGKYSGSVQYSFYTMRNDE